MHTKQAPSEIPSGSLAETLRHWRGADVGLSVLACFSALQRARADTVHAFRVEATPAEAEAAIFPHLSANAVAEAKSLAEEYAGLAERLGSPARPFCFLVARDLGPIKPHPVHYPFHQMWNAYLPFRTMAEQYIDGLEELKELDCPPAN